MQDVVELSDATYSEFIENCDDVVFIDFYSNSCPPCQTLLSYLPSLSEHYKDKKVVIAKVNSAHNPKLSTKFMVRSVPLTVVIGQDKMVKRAEVGLLTLENYFKMIDKEIQQKKGLFSRLFGV